MSNGSAPPPKLSIPLDAKTWLVVAALVGGPSGFERFMKIFDSTAIDDVSEKQDELRVELTKQVAELKADIDRLSDQVKQSHEMMLRRTEEHDRQAPAPRRRAVRATE